MPHPLNNGQRTAGSTNRAKEWRHSCHSFSMRINGITLDYPSGTRKVAWKSAELFVQQAEPARHDIGLQVLLLKIKEAVEYLWGVRIPDYRAMDFIINFGAPVQEDGSIAYSVKLQNPVNATMRAKLHIDYENSGQAWVFYGNDDVVTLSLTSQGDNAEHVEFTPPDPSLRGIRLRGQDNG